MDLRALSATCPFNVLYNTKLNMYSNTNAPLFISKDISD